MTKVIAVVNQKGGVAKTTTTINVGAGLAQHGRNVLLVDLDGQGNLTRGLNCVPKTREKFTMPQPTTAVLTLRMVSSAGYGRMAALMKLSVWFSIISLTLSKSCMS